MATQEVDRAGRQRVAMATGYFARVARTILLIAWGKPARDSALSKVNPAPIERGSNVNWTLINTR
jgi:hypothetical protein